LYVKKTKTGDEGTGGKTGRCHKCRITLKKSDEKEWGGNGIKKKVWVNDVC